MLRIEKPSRYNTHLLLVEIIWWVITILATYIIIYPISQSSHGYPFSKINAISIITSITLFRYIFFLKYTFLAKRQSIKLVLVFLSIPLIFNMINNLNYFITYIDEQSYDPFLGHLDLHKRPKWETYIKSEMLLFGVGSIISSIVFPFRMILSIWRVKNRNTV